LFEAMDPIEQDFIQYVAKYRKNYGTKEEYNFRLQMYRDNVEKLIQFEAENSDSTSTVGVNLFSDMTP